jgi:FKBP-type peptidyl-prolyl cis-trans isomerase FkpA
MTTKKLLLIAGIAITIFQSCGDGFKTSDDGLKYKIHTKNEGEKIKEGDYVTLQMVYRTDSDSVLFDTYKMGQPVKLQVGVPTFKGDLMHGLMLLTEKDSATFMINADSLFEKTFHFDRPKFIAAGSLLKFEVKVDKVIPKEKMEEEMKAATEKQAQMEKQNIEKYIADKKLTLQTTGSGLMYTIIKEGKGEKPVAGDTVVVHYEGRLLNGNKFDSSYDIKKPFEFPVGQGAVIKGWDEALLLLNKGSKATLVVPSHLGYGQQEVGGGVIPAYSTLVFDVELVNVKKAKK